MALLEMGIPRHHAELSLEETGNVGVEVATEWLFSLPPHVLQQHIAERVDSGQSACPDGHYGVTHEVQMALEPRRIPLKARLCCCTCMAEIRMIRTYCLSVRTLGVVDWIPPMIYRM